MTQNDFKEMIQKHLREHGLENCPVKMTNAHRSLGSIYYRKWGKLDIKFKFSRHLIKANPGVANNTILHEIAHALDVQNRGYSDHGPQWQKICREIGANPKARADNAYDDSIYRYQIICQSCGESVAKRHKITSRSIEMFSRSWCKPCGHDSKLEIIDTNTQQGGQDMRTLDTMKELLDELNRFRVKNGKKSLKSWKGSKEKAVDAIKAEVIALKPKKKVAPVEKAPAKKAPTPKDPTLPDTRPDWITDMDKNIDETLEPKTTFTLVELAVELKISPKVARAKLRRNVDDVPPRVEGKGWTFANGVRDALIKLLS